MEIKKNFKQFVHIKRGLRHKRTRATSKLRGEMLLSNLCSCQVIDSKAQKILSRLEELSTIREGTKSCEWRFIHPVFARYSHYIRTSPLPRLRYCLSAVNLESLSVETPNGLRKSLPAMWTPDVEPCPSPLNSEQVKLGHGWCDGTDNLSRDFFSIDSCFCELWKQYIYIWICVCTVCLAASTARAISRFGSAKRLWWSMQPQSPPLKGRNDKGEFATSCAKIYPPSMNEARALSFTRFLDSR